MIAPGPIDVDIPLLKTFVTEAKFLNHSQRSRVLWPDVDLCSVKSNHVEKVVGDQGDRGWCDSFTGHIGGDPVTDDSTRNRAVDYVCHVDLANNFSLVFDQKRQACLVIVCAKQRADHAFYVKGIGCVRTGGLPRAKPGSVLQQALLKHLGVSHADKPQAHIAVSESKRHGHGVKISGMSNSNVADDKKLLRAQLAKQRPALSAQSGVSQKLQQAITELATQTNAKVVAAYLPFGSEPDIGGFIAAAAGLGIRLIMPVSVADGTLRWVNYDGRMAPGIFGFAEPIGEPATVADADLILVPASAVDATGARLGKGKGYYDIALSSVGNAAKTAAVVYDQEVLNKVPTEPHDQTMDYLVTPSGFKAAASR